MSWNRRACGKEVGKDNTAVLPLKGQGNFRPFDEGHGSYTAFTGPNCFKDQNKAVDHLSRKIRVCKRVCAGSGVCGPGRPSARLFLLR